MANDDLRFEKRIEESLQEGIDESRQEEFNQAQELGEEYISFGELDELQELAAA